MATKKKAPKGKKKAPAAIAEKPKRMRQTRIPGTEGEVEPEVHAAGSLYTKLRDDHKDLTRELKGAKTALINTMKRLGVEVYKDMEADPPVVIVVSSKDEVKVTELGADDPERAELPDAGDAEEAETNDDGSEHQGADVEQLEPDREDAGGDENEPPEAA